MTELPDLGAHELSQAYAARSVSPVEVTRAVLERIDAWEPKINAMYRVRREAALADAEKSEQRWRSGAALGPLDGVPITIKENLYTAGDPAPIGSAAAEPVPMSEDSPVAARVREAGCVLLGKTTMPDLGMLSSGRSSFHGTTRNPWRLDLNPAGSSSGAGAACAAGYGPLHVGTDIGGSIRLPAHHCGLFGLKPSLGRVPINPPYVGRVAGPMTRTVIDAAMLMQVISRPDVRDWMSLPAQDLDYASQLEGLSLKGLRIGLWIDAGAGLPLEASVREAVLQAAAALEAHGALVTPMPTFMSPELLDGVCRFLEARSQRDVAAMSEQQRARILPYIVEWATWRASAFSGSEVMGAWGALMAMREAAVRAVGAFDYVVAPTAPVLCYSAEAHGPTDDPRRALEHIAYTVAFNMSEQPAASINWHHSAEGLPVGVQLIGQRFDDLGVMRLSRVIEQLRPAQKAWPGIG
jgi:aspartyl-tRNA(Asn)/glutamyl-tRNA(Gln) amidotransferase subunit A